MTPAALADLYGGEIVTDSPEYRAIRADLAAMRIAELRQTHRLAPAFSRLRAMADAEIERRASARASRRVARTMAAAVVMPRARVERREEV